MKTKDSACCVAHPFRRMYDTVPVQQCLTGTSTVKGGCFSGELPPSDVPLESGRPLFDDSDQRGFVRRSHVIPVRTIYLSVEMEAFLHACQAGNHRGEKRRERACCLDTTFSWSSIPFELSPHPSLHESLTSRHCTTERMKHS
jgi:hypothetical protein